jgi:hypothetical protein
VVVCMCVCVCVGGGGVSIVCLPSCGAWCLFVGGARKAWRTLHAHAAPLDVACCSRSSCSLVWSEFGRRRLTIQLADSGCTARKWV